MKADQGGGVVVVPRNWSSSAGSMRGSRVGGITSLVAVSQASTSSRRERQRSAWAGSPARFVVSASWIEGPCGTRSLSARVCELLVGLGDVTVHGGTDEPHGQSANWFQYATTSAVE